MSLSEMNETLALQARELGCRRGDRQLFSGLELSLAAGEMLWLRGDNGQGKTSLLRLLAGLAVPASGDVWWFGFRARTAAAVVALPLYVAHANALKDDLTVHEALAFLVELSVHAPSAPTTSAIDEALDRVGMRSVAQTMVRALSQGQRRRVALARLAMPHSARVWLLDEPYDALDLASTQALNKLLGEQLARGGSVVLTSHQDLSPDAPPATEFWLQRRPQLHAHTQACTQTAVQRDNRAA